MQSQPDGVRRECQRTAVKLYELALTKVYQALRQSLDPVSAKLLLDSQRQWLAARAVDQALWNGPWFANSGSLGRLNFGVTEADRLRQRVGELNDILTNIE